MDTILDQLLSWYREPGAKRPDVFHPDFTYTCQVGLLDVDEWWHIVSDTASPDLVVIGRLASNTSAALFMEKTEPVSSLRRRIAWWITGHDGKISTLLDVRTPIPSE